MAATPPGDPYRGEGGAFDVAIILSARRNLNIKYQVSSVVLGGVLTRAAIFTKT